MLLVFVPGPAVGGFVPCPRYLSHHCLILWQTQTPPVKMQTAMVRINHGGIGAA